MRVNQLIIQALKGECSNAELRELDAWRNASSDNERHYQDFVALWKLTEGADDLAVRPPPDVGAIVREDVTARPRRTRVVRLAHDDTAARSGTRGGTWRKRWMMPSAAAAAVVVLAFGIWTVATSSFRPHAAPLALGADEFVTGTAEMATVSLRDGSVVRLAPNSRLQLSGTTEERGVALRGRAYFAVAPDEPRPFRIEAEAADVTVIGTRFDLQSEGDDLRLIVVEGSVQLSAGGRQVEVAAGEMSRVLGGTLVPTVSIPDIFSLVDWVGNFLAFQATPLAQAALEIEREYGVRVVITDDELARRTVTGWFSDKTLEEVLRIVCAIAAAQCTTDGNVVTVAPAAGGVDTTLSGGR